MAGRRGDQTNRRPEDPDADLSSIDVREISEFSIGFVFLQYGVVGSRRASRCRAGPGWWSPLALGSSGGFFSLHRLSGSQLLVGVRSLQSFLYH